MNGFQYGDNTGYDGNGMPQDGRHDMQSMMMMGQAGLNGDGGSDENVAGGQSLDGMVNMGNFSSNLNSKMIRRQSMPQGFANAAQNQGNNYSPGVRRINSMMDFNGNRSPAEAMNSYPFNPGMNMDQTGSMSGNTPTTQSGQVPIQNRRQSGNNELNLNTNFSSTSQNYGAMMNQNSAYASPAHQPSLDIDMNSPYLDPSLAMQMDFSLDQNGMGNNVGNMGNGMAVSLGNNMRTGLDPGMSGNMGNNMGGNMNGMGGGMGNMGNNANSNLGGNLGANTEDIQMPMYNQPQYNQNVVASPIHQGTPQDPSVGSTRVSSQDATALSGSSSQYGRKSQRPSMPHQLSRSQSNHVSSAASPQQPETPTTGNDGSKIKLCINQASMAPIAGFKGNHRTPCLGQFRIVALDALGMTTTA